MTFDTRARRAAQGIHRAVETMETTSATTAQPLARFDTFRDRRSRNQRVAALVVGLGLAVALVVAVVRVAGSNDGSVPVSPPSLAPAPENRPDVFEPAFTYSLPDGWEVTGDDARYFAIRPTEAPAGYNGIYLFAGVVASSPNCSLRPVQDVGTSSAEITTWMSSHPALESTSPQKVTVNGTTGHAVDIELVKGWDRTCGFGDVPLVTGQPEGDESWSIAPGQRMRVYVFDLPKGETVTIVVEADAPTRFQTFVEEAVPIVESFDLSA